ncbi:hypothetical protein FAIPA1_70184 [Frankia sp. AiPs1]
MGRRAIGIGIGADARPGALPPGPSPIGSIFGHTRARTSACPGWSPHARTTMQVTAPVIPVAH